MSEVSTVMALKQQRLRALVERDILTADHLHHEDYELITPGGHRHTKSSYLEDVASKRLEYLAFERMTPVAVRAPPAAARLHHSPVSGFVGHLRYAQLIRMSFRRSIDREVQRSPRNQGVTR